MNGPSIQVLFAFVMLISGGISDLVSRKLLILGAFAVQTFVIYLCSMTETYRQLFMMKMLIGILNSVVSPCSYGILTDWVPPESRTLAYAWYALGV